MPHTAALYPQSTEVVVNIVKAANKYRMPSIPYPGGTALEGHYFGLMSELNENIYFAYMV